MYVAAGSGAAPLALHARRLSCWQRGMTAPARSPAGVEALELFVEVLSQSEARPRRARRSTTVCARRSAGSAHDAPRGDLSLRHRAAAGPCGRGVRLRTRAVRRRARDRRVGADRAPGRCARTAWSRWTATIGGQVPAEYAALFPEPVRLVCAPMAAAGRAIGVILADRLLSAPPLDDAERHLLWTLGKAAALASVARSVATQGEGRAQLEQRIDLAREIHEGVIQRLFGVSMALDAEGDLPRRARRAVRDRDAGGAVGAAQRAPATARARAARDADDVRGRGPAARPRAPRSRRDARGRRRGRRPARARAAGAVGPGRGGAQRAQAREPDPGQRPGRAASRARSCSRSPTTASTAGAASRGHGSAAGGVRGAPERRRGGVRRARAGNLAGPARRALRVRLTRSRSPDRLCVLVVDDHDVVHWGFRLMLSQQPWVERCLSAHSGAEALALAARYRPHVALVDLFIGEESGAEVCEQLRAAEPMTRVLLFSGAGEISPSAARAAGASGFAYKDWPARRIAERGAAGRARAGRCSSATTAMGALGLSDRERAVLEADGVGLDQPGDRRRAASLQAHGQGAHQRGVPQAGRAQPNRGGAAGQRLGLMA